MEFRDLACAHLSNYRKNVLGLQDEGIFHYRGRQIPIGHILPCDDQELNILAPYRDTFLKSPHRSSIKLHKYFHHLNSSQALCINLFFPLIASQRNDLLLHVLGAPADMKPIPRFEAESILEKNAKRRTSFDFHLPCTTGRQVFVEVKYTENSFGGALHDEHHIHKYHDTYQELVTRSPFLVEKCRDCTHFLDNYQVMRNLVHLDHQSDVVFLFPRMNQNVKKQAENAREHFVAEHARHKLRILFLEDVVAELKQKTRNEPLGEYYAAFEQKYLGFVQSNGLESGN